MKTSDIINWNASAPEYIDLDVYIEPDGGPEYKFTLSYDKEERIMYDGPVQSSPDTKSEYADCVAVPADVVAAYRAIRPTMVAQINALIAVQ